MKKFLSLLLAAMLGLSAVGCSGGSKGSGSLTDESVTGTDAVEESSAWESASEASEEMTGEFETANIKLINGLYEGEDAALINSLQGHITIIDNGGTFPVLIADKTVYSEDYGTLKEIISLPAVPDSVIYFDNISIGENLLYFKDSKLNLYPADEYGIRFTDIAFNEETDFVGEIGLSSYFKIIRKENGSYIIDYYESDDESGVFVLESHKPLENIQTPDVKTLSVKEIIPLRSHSNGYYVYILTDSNDVYAIDSISSRGKMTTMSSNPIVSNVDRIIAPADVNTYLTTPIYSKIGDSANLYSGAPGASLIETSDNFEIAFILPHDQTPEKVTDVFSVSDKLVFVFANGDTYYTDDIEKEERTSYDMTKLDEVSHLKAGGTILDMAGAMTLDDNLYMLMSDGKLYYIPLD